MASEAARAPLLGAHEILERAAAHSLPEAFRARVSATYMRPILSRGDEVMLVRRQPLQGDVICFAAGAQLVWRRVLDDEPGRLVVRADLAPASEEWSGEVLGCVARTGLKACQEMPPAPGAASTRLEAHGACTASPRYAPGPSTTASSLKGLSAAAASSAPLLWTRGVWSLALALAHARAARARLLSRRRRGALALAAQARPLTGPDVERLNEFGRAVMGLDHDLARGRPDMHFVGALDASGAILGHYTLVARAAPAHASGLFVDPRLRGGGIGRLLVVELVALARQLGVDEVRCDIAARNLASARAHRAAGFAELPSKGAPSSRPEDRSWSIRL